jgi:CBS domain-containing protein
MEIELLEIRDFLAAQPPFDRLPEAALNALTPSLSVIYLRREAPFPPENLPAEVYILRSGAVEWRDAQGDLLARLSEGQLYAGACHDGALEAQFIGRAIEDSLIYVLPCARLAELRREHPEFDRHFSRTLRERLQAAVQQLQGAGGQRQALLYTHIADLITRPPVYAPPETSIRQAAQIMSEERITSLLILHNERLLGIITDRDLRRRCLAEGVPMERPVTDIMSQPVRTLPDDALAFEALLAMTRFNLNHIPVTERGRIVGVITNGDLIRLQSSNAVYLVRELRKCESDEALAQASEKLPELQAQLIHAGIGAREIGQTITVIADTLTERLLQLAEQQLGTAPVPYVWLAVGAQARRELSVFSDQDNALLLHDDYEQDRHGHYFEALAQFVNTGLRRCGFIECRGGIMASNAQWRQPRRIWRDYFRHWINEPDTKSVMLACNFHDMRPVHGAAELYHSLRDEVVELAAGNAMYLAHLAANTITTRPALGFFRRFLLDHRGDQQNALDIKQHGTLLIVALARLLAVAARSMELDTLERLEAARAQQELSVEGLTDLREAFELSRLLDLRHQSQCFQEGHRPDHLIAPDSLSARERAHLKDAFSAIRTVQLQVEQRFHSTGFARP